MEPWGSPPDPPPQHFWTKQRKVPRWLKWLEWEFILFPFGPLGLVILGVLIHSRCGR